MSPPIKCSCLLPYSSSFWRVSLFIPCSLCLFTLKDGVFVRGLYLEGAGWDKKNSCLVEAEPMQMVCPIPTIHFKPVENRKKMAKSELLETYTVTSSLSFQMFSPFSVHFLLFNSIDLVSLSQLCLLCVCLCVRAQVCTCARVITSRCVRARETEHLLWSV